jgi:hypothetical protein
VRRTGKTSPRWKNFTTHAISLTSVQGRWEWPRRWPSCAAAAAELQREERPALQLADLVDADDVGVLQPDQGLRLDAEAIPVVGGGVPGGGVLQPAGFWREPGRITSGPVRGRPCDP